MALVARSRAGAQPATLVRDLNSTATGPSSGVVTFLGLTVVVGRLCYRSLEERQLWRTDATRAGTYPLTDPPLTVGPSGLQPEAGAAFFHGTYYFRACVVDGAGHASCEVWPTDGTREGIRVFRAGSRLGAVFAVAGDRL